MLEPTITMTDYISVTSVITINDLPDELLRIISILGGPTEYCNFRRAMKRLWLSTTGREDHCIKHFLVTKVTKHDTIETTLCGKLHSMFDQPAIIWCYGTKQWCQHGKLHRDNDLPAIIYPSGAQVWHQHGKKHRDNDQPAVVYPDGEQQWWQHGKLHRDNDQPATRTHDGTRLWYQHGKRHRDNDLPACIGSNGTQEWWQHGEKYIP